MLEDTTIKDKLFMGLRLRQGVPEVSNRKTWIPVNDIVKG